MIRTGSNRQLTILEDLTGEDAEHWRSRISGAIDSPAEERSVLKNGSFVGRQLAYADLKISPATFIILSLISATIVSVLACKILSSTLLLIYLLIGFVLPILYVEKRIKDRANRFTEDYSTMLMAAASSIKVGLTPYQALERSVNLLPRVSIVKAEVLELLSKLKNGETRDRAIAEFASTVRQPDVELFRSAFSLVLENGGRFAPTLTRLASVSYGRMSLIRSALVSTANMRMTANFLLLAAPVLLLMMSVKTPNYWETLFNNPQANTFGSVGALMILGAYAVLRHFSNFKP